jgi:hypothetical protein
MGRCGDNEPAPAAGVTWLLASFGRQPAAEVEAQVHAGPPGPSGRLGA